MFIESKTKIIRPPCVDYFRNSRSGAFAEFFLASFRNYFDEYEVFEKNLKYL